MTRIEKKRIYAATYRKKHREAITTRGREYYAKNKEKMKTYHIANDKFIKIWQSGYRKKNKKSSRVYGKKWRSDNKIRKAKMDKEYYLNNKSDALSRARKHHLRKSYGITPEEYDTLLNKQNMVCAICGIKKNGKGKLHIDHDHKTGKVRGLLCMKCNTMLGLSGDNTATLASAIEYSENN